MTDVGPLESYRLKNGKLKYQIELIHNGLKRHKVVKGDYPDIVQRKAQVQAADWDERWATELEKRSRAAQREQRQDEADQRTREAQEQLQGLETLLAHTLNVDDAIEWDSLKVLEPFSAPEPNPPQRPQEPRPDSPAYTPRLSLLDRLFTSRRERKEAWARGQFEDVHAEWASRCAQAEKDFETAHTTWEAEKAEYEEQRTATNAQVDRLKELYLSGDPGAVVEYCDLVLSRSEYPDSFPQEFDLFYNPDTRILVADYLLPAPEDLPTLKEVKYIKSRDALDEKHLSERDINRAYDEVVYQIALRTIHELFEADQADALDAVVFNGRVDTIDKATGKEINACVLSLQAGKEEFLEINLARVEPKTCFKALKGVGSSKLHSITPVAPIIQVDDEDARFVESYGVAGGMDETTNLAAIDWEDFEHLIREIFEQEFAEGGGQVKVTQASRDGGVDAIAFDPDPIRGGKIVIQAKRYTNTVGVAAVRDLYGTVMNEGAIKGILVTTSDYGPDAYSFAKDKPLSLLNGSNLLHLLERHGHKARIDVKEAKRLAD